MADGCGSVVVVSITANDGLGCSCAGFNGSWFLGPFQGSCFWGSRPTGLRVGMGM